MVRDKSPGVSPLHRRQHSLRKDTFSLPAVSGGGDGGDVEWDGGQECSCGVQSWSHVQDSEGVPSAYLPYVYLAKPCLPACPRCLLWTIALNSCAVSYHVSHRKRGQCLMLEDVGPMSPVPVASRLWDSRPVASSLNFKILYSIPTYRLLFFPCSRFRVAWGPGLTLTSFSFTFNIQLVCRKSTAGGSIVVEPCSNPIRQILLIIHICTWIIHTADVVISFSISNIFTYATAASSIWASFSVKILVHNTGLLDPSHEPSLVLSPTEETLELPHVALPRIALTPSGSPLCLSHTGQPSIPKQALFTLLTRIRFVSKWQEYSAHLSILV